MSQSLHCGTVSGGWSSLSLPAMKGLGTTVTVTHRPPESANSPLLQMHVIGHGFEMGWTPPVGVPTALPLLGMVVQAAPVAMHCTSP